MTKKNYTLSLPLEVVEDLRFSYGFKLSEDISNILIDKLADLKNASTIVGLPKTEKKIPAWYDTVDLSTYKRLLEKPDRYFIWYEKINGTFDHDALMDYLKEKYAKDII